MLMSDNQKYLKKIRLEKLFILFIQIFIVIIFFTIWEYLAYKEYINTFIYSSSRMVSTIKELIITNNLFNHIWKTVYEIIISFVLGGSLGIIIIAIILYEFKYLARIVEPFLILLNLCQKLH